MLRDRGVAVCIKRGMQAWGDHGINYAQTQKS